MAPTKVADLSVDELKELIREVVAQTILETVKDSDEGLELREETESALQISLAHIEADGKTRSAQEIAAELGLEW